MSDGAKQVICIDDDPDMVELYSLIIENNGFEGSGAPGRNEGYRKVHETTPDLAILGLMMAGMQGWKVYQHLKAGDKTRRIPVKSFHAEFDPKPNPQFA